MKDELIDHLNAKIERDQKLAADFGLLNINRLFTKLTRFKFPELPDFTEVNSVKSFLRSFS